MQTGHLKHLGFLLLISPLFMLEGPLAAQPTDNDLLAGFCLGAGQVEAADSEKVLNEWSVSNEDRASSQKFEINHLSRFQNYLTARGFPNSRRDDQTAITIAIGQGRRAAADCRDEVSKKVNKCGSLMPRTPPFDFQSYEHCASVSRGKVSSCERVDRCHKSLELPF